MWNPPADIRQRWIDDDFRLEHLAMDALLQGRLGKAGLGVHQGRVDLRAFDTPPAHPRLQKRPGRLGRFLDRKAPNKDRPSTLRGGRIESVDFTHARIPGLTFDAVVLVDCVFDRANLDNTRFAACRFEQCSFARADLVVASLGQIWNPAGPLLPSSFTDCRFINAMFGFTFCYGSEFIRCDFSRARFKDSLWYGARFVDCIFAGEIKGAEFRSTDPSARLPVRPDMLDGVDLSRTSLRDCEFYGLNLRDTRLPQDGDHLVVQDYPCFLEHAVALLAQPRTMAGEYSLESMRRAQELLGPDQKQGVLNLRDRVYPWPAEGQRELATAFDKALAECGQTGPVLSRMTGSEASD